MRREYWFRNRDEAIWFEKVFKNFTIDKLYRRRYSLDERCYGKTLDIVKECDYFFNFRIDEFGFFNWGLHFDEKTKPDLNWEDCGIVT